MFELHVYIENVKYRKIFPFISLILIVPAQELHSIFRLPFQTLVPKAIHYMNSCILQSLSSFLQRKGYCILHYDA